MRCPICEQEMLDGKDDLYCVSVHGRHALSLKVEVDGFKKPIKADLSKMMRSFYCAACNKIVLISDAVEPKT